MPVATEVAEKKEDSKIEIKPETTPAKKSFSKPARRKSEFALPSTWDKVESKYEEHTKAEKAKENGVETETEYVLNPSVEIDTTLFEQNLKDIIQKLKKENKMNMAMALESGNSVLTHNCWKLSLENDLLLRVMDRNKDRVLNYFRSKLQQPDLFLEMNVEAPNNIEKATKPYTNEEKLREMSQNNPALQELQKIFKTRIIYS